MHDTRFLQLDVFPARPGGGNPLGVVFGADGWSAETMQRLAHWTNLVETTFVLAPVSATASYRLRIFTPHKEIPFAGHPSVGSAHAVLETGFARPRQGRLLQECGAGLLPIRIDGDGAARQLLVQTPVARVLVEGEAARQQLSTALAGRRAGGLAPALIEGGRRWWLAELADEAEVRDWRPDHGAIRALAESTDSLGLCVFARTGTGAPHLVVRAFPAGAGIVEDPASGAANGLIASYLALRADDPTLAGGYEVSQGREIGCDARLALRIGIDGQVWVGGRTRTVIDGRLHWPETGAAGATTAPGLRALP